MSLSGGIDLSKLKSNSDAEPEKRFTVPSLVTQLTEATLPQLVKLSNSAPIVIEFFEAEPDSTLESVIRSLDGQLLLTRSEFSTESKLVQAFGVKNPNSVYALVKGQPAALFEGRYSAEQYLAVMNQLLAAAKAQGVVGRLVEGSVAEAIPELPKPLQEALALVDSGEVDQALELLTKLKAESPKDLATSALLAQVQLMQRTMNLDHEGILASQPKTFDEALLLADVLAAIGDFQSCFDLLLALYVQISKDEQELAKSRLLEYFEIAGGSNELVKKARARLATLLY